MSDTDSNNSRDTGSSRTTKDSSTVATTVDAIDNTETATVNTSTASGHPPSNPETASRVESDDSTIDREAYGNAPELRVNNGRPDYGSQLCVQREEPWVPGVSPRPSSSNLRGQANADSKQGDADQSGSKKTG